MIVVDTGVWIDFFANRATSEVEYLTKALEAEQAICFTGVILQELLQGIRSPKQRHLLEENFLPFIELFPSRTTYRLAAELFRNSRAAGHPIRSSIDCLIAACCIEQGVKILEKDKDYRYIAEISKLVRICG